jgi:hypothetical protein
MRAMDTTGTRVSRTRKSGHGAKPVGPAGGRGQVLELGAKVRVVEEGAVDRAVEDHDLDSFVGFER